MRDGSPTRVLVTGSTRGIGAEIVSQLADRGCKVAVHGMRDIARVLDFVGRLAGVGHVGVVGDLRDASERQRLFGDTIDGLGGVDILIHNAGIYSPHAIAGDDDEAWNAAWAETLEINLNSAAHLSKLAVQSWADRSPDGWDTRIVAVGSRGAVKGEPFAPAYAASKAGLTAFVQSLAVALGSRGVVACAVSPGVVETDMTRAVLGGSLGDSLRRESPLGRVATPTEVATIVTWLALDAPAAISGAVVDVNGASYLR